jgi:hypothetical protein
MRGGKQQFKLNLLVNTIQRGPIEIQTSDRTAAVDSHHNRTLLLASSFSHLSQTLLPR